MDIITQLFQKIDQVAASAIQQIYQAISQGLLPVFTVAVTIYVAYWGYEMIYGRAPLSAGAFIWRIARIALIYALAFGWSDFSAIVVETFTKSSDGIASAVCTAVGGSSCGTPETSVSSTLSTLFSNAMNAGKIVAASGGWGAAIGLSLLAIVLLIATVIFVTVAVTLVMIGKVALFVLLGIAPIFIAMALFNFTSVLFTGWLRTVAQYSIVPIIVYGILGFLLTLMNQTIANLGTITDVTSGMTVIAPFLILCGVGSALLPLALSMAASIAGGHALQNVRPWALGPLGMATRLAGRGAALGAVGALTGAGYGYRQLASRQSGGGATMTADQNTMQGGPLAGGDPRAEQVAAALIESRRADLKELSRDK